MFDDEWEELEYRDQFDAEYSWIDEDKDDPDWFARLADDWDEDDAPPDDE